jgi:hypothetical protein
MAGRSGYSTKTWRETAARNSTLRPSIAVSETGYRISRRRIIPASPSRPVANRTRLAGSGVATDETTLVSADGSVTVVVPSRFKFNAAAKPSVVSVVRTGTVPAESENMLNAKMLPDVDTPSGALSAGP